MQTARPNTLWFSCAGYSDLSYFTLPSWQRSGINEYSICCAYPDADNSGDCDVTAIPFADFLSVTGNTNLCRAPQSSQTGTVVTTTVTFTTTVSVTTAIEAGPTDSTRRRLSSSQDAVFKHPRLTMPGGNITQGNRRLQQSTTSAPSATRVEVCLHLAVLHLILQMRLFFHDHCCFFTSPINSMWGCCSIDKTQPVTNHVVINLRNALTQMSRLKFGSGQLCSSWRQ